MDKSQGDGSPDDTTQSHLGFHTLEDQSQLELGTCCMTKV